MFEHENPLSHKTVLLEGFIKLKRVLKLILKYALCKDCEKFHRHPMKCILKCFTNKRKLSPGFLTLLL